MQIDTILFPTDFSANAVNSAKIAASVADVFYAKIIVVHSLHASSVPEDKTTTENKVKWARQKLEEVKLQILQKNPLLNVTTFVIKDGYAETLEFIKSQGIDLVIMGATGEGGTKDILLGSFAAKLIDQSPCPVLAIPEKATAPEFKKMVYASDLDNIDVESISELCTFATYFNAEITILNVSDQNRRFSEEQLFKFEKQVRETASYPKLDFIYFHGSDVNRHIQEYMKRNSSDLFVITTVKDSIISRTFQDKNSPRLGYHKYIPLMAFNESDKCCQKVN